MFLSKMAGAMLSGSSPVNSFFADMSTSSSMDIFCIEACVE